jgi:ribose transport system substrate-binding protein
MCCALFSLLIVTCGTGSAADKPVLGIAMLDMTQEFFVNMITAGEQAAKDYDVELNWKSADQNLDKQIAIIENFIEQKVNCILIDPYDAEGLIPVCEKAQAAGIPVISMGNFIDSPAVTSNLYNDYEDTKVVGQVLIKLIGEKGEVGFLYGAAGNFVSDERQRGFEDAVAMFPGVKVTSLPVGWDTATTLKVTQDLLASNPNIVGLHSFSDGNTMAAYQAIEQAGKTKDILVSSYDGNKDASEAVKAGKYVCTVLTGAKRVGYWNVKVGAQLARKENVAQKNYLKSHIIMNDDLKAKVKEWGIGYEGMSVINPDEGIKMFDDLTQGF